MFTLSTARALLHPFLTVLILDPTTEQTDTICPSFHDTITLGTIPLFEETAELDYTRLRSWLA